MKKSNPFYHYLVKYHQLSVTHKIDTHGSHFLVIALEQPDSHLTFDYHETTLTFIEHHISVYDNINDETGFKSTYHYTAKFETHTLHIYFNENGEYITATMEQNDNNNIISLHYLFDDTNEELMSIRTIIEQQVNVKVQSLHAQHLSTINDLEVHYTEALEHLKNRLFDASESVSDNIKLIRKAIKKAEQLLPINYKQHFVKDTMHYLNRCLNTLTQVQTETQRQETSVQAIKKTAGVDEILTDSPSTISAPSSTAISKRSSSKRSKRTDVISESDNQTVIENFQSSYNAYVSQWAAFAECPDFATKIELFVHIGTEHISMLNASALILQTQITNPTSLFEQSLLSKSELDVNLYQEMYQKTGINLLLNCLKSEESLSNHWEKLKTFAPLIDHTHLKTFIRQQNIPAIAFLLEHGAFKINHVLIDFKKGPALSPLCAAYKYGNIQLFELLLKNNASCMALYEDLPFAHTLLQLHASNLFYNAFLKHYQPAFNASSRFYKALCSALNIKLKKEQLDETQREKLILAEAEYKQRSEMNHGEIITLSNSTRSNIISIREAMDPSVIQSFREHSPEVIELSEKSAELYKLLRKTHQSIKIKRACEKHYANAKQLLDNGLVGIFYNLSKEQITDSIKNNINVIQASIDYLTLHVKKHLTPSENKTLKQAAHVLKQSAKEQQLQEDQNEIPRSSHGVLSIGVDILKSTLGLEEYGRIDGLENILNSMNCIFKRITAGDEVTDLDFLAHLETESSSQKLAEETVLQGEEGRKIAVDTDSSTTSIKQNDPSVDFSQTHNERMDDEVFYANHPYKTGASSTEEDLMQAVVRYSGTLFGSSSELTIEQIAEECESNTKTNN